MAFKVAADLRIDEVILLGDAIDCYTLSSHSKDPGITKSLADEIQMLSLFLARIEKTFPKAKLVYIQGNHEDRMERYIEKHCRELYGLVSLEKILGLRNRGWVWVPSGPNQKYRVLGSDLYARHTPISCGQNAASLTLAKAGCNIICGHLHRSALAMNAAMDGKTRMAMLVGCMLRRNHSVYSYVKGINTWNRGFAIVHAKGKRFYPELVWIQENDTCLANGKVYKA